MDDPLRDRLERAGAALVSYGADEVYPCGFAARGERDERPDVDLAVPAPPPGPFLGAMTQAGHVIEAPPDLVDAEHCGLFAERLTRKGKLVRAG